MINKESSIGAYGKSLFNTFYNPFEKQDILAPGNASGLTRSLYHAAMLGLGYGGAAYAFRHILANKDKAERGEYSRADAEATYQLAESVVFSEIDDFRRTDVRYRIRHHRSAHISRSCSRRASCCCRKWRHYSPLRL